MAIPHSHQLSLVGFAVLGAIGAAAGQSAANPVAQRYGDAAPAWTSELAWGNVVSIREADGKNWNMRFAAAQARLGAKGGVVLFPAGEYRFEEDLELVNGVIIMGAAPAKDADARNDDYRLTTRFEFPRYQPKFSGEGTPNDTAFKKITLADPATASNVGVVFIHVNNAHIYLPEGPDRSVGRNRLIFGNILTNTASVAHDVPRRSAQQPAWHRWTDRHRAAIHVHSQENLLIAGNRVPKSGQGNFAMPDYHLARKKDHGIHDLAFDPAKHEWSKEIVSEGVVFDYDNRPGIYANDMALGAPGDGLPNGAPQSHPHGFREGTVIRDNYIFCTGRCGISFSGDGTRATGNVIRIPPGTWRPTCRGFEISGGGSTNDNRAIQCRGYRYTVENNDYDVHSNRCFDRKHYICDGEGIMHENHVNSKVLDSRIIGNKGNAYICVWRVEVDGLEIAGNRIEKAPSAVIGVEAAINVQGRKSSGEKRYVPVRNLRIENNFVTNAGIVALGESRGGNIVKGNHYAGASEGLLVIENSVAGNEANEGFELFTSQAEAKASRK